MTSSDNTSVRLFLTCFHYFYKCLELCCSSGIESFCFMLVSDILVACLILDVTPTILSDVILSCVYHSLLLFVLNMM